MRLHSGRIVGQPEVIQKRTSRRFGFHPDSLESNFSQADFWPLSLSPTQAKRFSYDNSSEEGIRANFSHEVPTLSPDVAATPSHWPPCPPPSRPNFRAPSRSLPQQASA